MSTPRPPVSSKQLSATRAFPWDTSTTRAVKDRESDNRAALYVVNTDKSEEMEKQLPVF